MTSPEPPLKQSWLASDRAVPRLFARPIRTFLSTESAGGLVLLAATVTALVWANLPLGYESFWTTEIALSVGSFEIAEDLRHWVNDALMVIFFFVVGLEIKRELVVGELNDARKAFLPAIAALGGMAGPALLYFALNPGGAAAGGWGIPMATDIAFAVGVLALLSRRVPIGLKVFLLSLAIVDDIGAILVIALFYSSGLQLSWLMGAGLLLGAILILRRLRVYWVPIYVVLGAVVWFATFESGVHATIAGVALGLLTPARPSDPGGFKDVLREANELPSEPDAQSLREIALQGNEVVSVAERLEHLLHPWTSFLVIPVFALANAGLRLSPGTIGDGVTSRVAMGIMVGLVAGKIVGISLASWLAIRSGIARLPDGVTWRHIIGGSAVAGIGFTVSLFITGLAFSDPALVADSKIGILIGSIIAGLIGSAILTFRGGATSRST
jgi:NhaA family Na+:H+ antiporter